MTSESLARAIVLLVALGGSVVACDLTTSAPTSAAASGPLRPAQTLASISPTGAVAGSPDLTLTLTGSGFKSGRLKGSRAAWRRGDDIIYLTTTFVSSALLTAVVPAELLRDAVAAQVYVATGDIMGDVPLAQSNAVAFTILPPPPTSSAQALDSISPTSAVAGSPDLTLTLIGSGFKSGRIKGSRATWRRGDSTSYLPTTFVSSTHLTAVVPAELLRHVVPAQVYVATGDVMGDIPLRQSNAVAFTIMPPSTTSTLGAPQLAGDHRSSLPTVFDVSALGRGVAFSQTLLATDPICLYWWDRRGFAYFEACHGYRVTIPAAGRLTVTLTSSQNGWMDLSSDDASFLPTSNASPVKFSRAVQAGQTVVVIAGNHGGNPRIDYNLWLQLTP